MILQRSPSWPLNVMASEIMMPSLAGLDNNAIRGPWVAKTKHAPPPRIGQDGSMHNQLDETIRSDGFVERVTEMTETHRLTHDDGSPNV